MGWTRARWTGVLAAGMALGLVTAPAAAGADVDQASYLFVINSKRGTISGVGKDTGKEKLTLTLRAVNDHATQFADRPIRKAYVLSTRDLTVRWNRWFKDNPPNAVLTFNQHDDPMPHSIVVKLTRPRYDANAQTLTFTARHIHRSPDLSPDALQRIALPKRRPPATFVRGSLFIDSVRLKPSDRVVNGCTIKNKTVCPGVDLSGQNLFGEHLAGANLTGAKFAKADLGGADLTGANLAGANLSGANLVGAGLSSADLSNADLSGADLALANLSGANLTDANLTKSNLSLATWSDDRRCGLDVTAMGVPPHTVAVYNYSGVCL